MTKLDQLKAAFAAATPGEWGGSPDGFVFGNGLRVADCECTDQDEMPEDEQIANTEFIALAHNLMPDLLELADLAKRASYNLKAYCGPIDVDTLAADIDELLEKLK